MVLYVCRLFETRAKSSMFELIELLSKNHLCYHLSECDISMNCTILYYDNAF